MAQHDLYVVHRSLKSQLKNLAAKASLVVGALDTVEETLHCGVRSYETISDYLYDYHTAKGDSGDMAFIAGPMANTQGVYSSEGARLDRIGSKRPKPVAKFLTVPMSAKQIGEIGKLPIPTDPTELTCLVADGLLAEFNAKQKNKEKYPMGGGYHLTEQNCQDFAACLIARLGVAEIDTVMKLIWGNTSSKAKRDRLEKLFKYESTALFPLCR
ncbi:hypothetical protein F5148DRAFT_49411 [Russula earlei]|uniref:Uncharacterized protein n=1 Tax=Russula earlei TaxID=71964 RepID=A0ACC0TR51_9AGAM|nr:hypothetical protein F5148DRAFT_49411 [Russula earlei]